MLNRVLLTARVGCEVQLRHDKHGSPVVNFLLLHDKGRFKATAWNKIAESAATELHRGDLVYVEGILETFDHNRNDDLNEEPDIVTVTKITIGYFEVLIDAPVKQRTPEKPLTASEKNEVTETFGDIKRTIAKGGRQ